MKGTKAGLCCSLMVHPEQAPFALRGIQASRARQVCSNRRSASKSVLWDATITRLARYLINLHHCRTSAPLGWPTTISVV
jgi:hypothetical protein